MVSTQTRVESAKKKKTRSLHLFSHHAPLLSPTQDARPTLAMPPQDEQARWLGEALAAVKRSAFYMRKAMVREKGGALKRRRGERERGRARAHARSPLLSARPA